MISGLGALHHLPAGGTGPAGLLAGGRPRAVRQFRLPPAGHQFTDASGAYRLETIVPGHAPGTPAIHLKVQAPNRPALTTQLYFPGEAGNARDGIYDPPPAGDAERPGPDGAAWRPSTSSSPWRDPGALRSPCVRALRAFLVSPRSQAPARALPSAWCSPRRTPG